MRREKITLDIDTRAFTAACQRAARAVQKFTRAIVRINDTRGDKHIERIILDCAARRLPVETTTRRLMVASDVAQVLDGRWKP